VEEAAVSIAGFFTGIANVLTGGVVEKVVGVVDKLVVDKDLREKLNAEFRKTQFVTEAALEEARIASETQIQVAQEVTHQAELNQADLYTKQTRPKIARQSWYVSGLYAVVCFVTDAVDLPYLKDMDFVWEVYLAAAAPALTYMGVRSFDIWRSGGAKRV
jgi:hypothetical protein